MATTAHNVIDSGGVLIAGAGLAGLFTALSFGDRPVTVLAAARPGAGASSAWAQGGIAAPLGPDDSPELHVQDTLIAGAGLVDERIARIMANEARPRVEDLCASAFPSIATRRGISFSAARPRIRASASCASRATAPARRS